MDEGAKRRLVGAAVLVALAVIFVPMLLDDKTADGLGEPIVIPDSPRPDRDSVAGSAGGSAAEPESAPLLPEPEVATDALPAPPPPAEAIAPPEPAPTPQPAAEPQPAPAAVSRPAPSPAASAAPSPAPVPKAVGPKPIPAGASAWVVQVASVGSEASARRLRDELRAKGYPAFIEQATVNGKRYHRVRVGPETDRARADGVAARIARETGNKPLVQTYR